MCIVQPVPTDPEVVGVLNIDGTVKFVGWLHPAGKVMLTSEPEPQSATIYLAPAPLPFVQTWYMKFTVAPAANVDPLFVCRYIGDALLLAVLAARYPLSLEGLLLEDWRVAKLDDVYGPPVAVTLAVTFDAVPGLLAPPVPLPTTWHRNSCAECAGTDTEPVHLMFVAL